ncbi:hypothetical protein X976_1283 [Burkholderia pseudomallei MSHR7500]|nr:hypothetical protein X976_1283 [Burkholderia pseudomallei MSHR7500]
MLERQRINQPWLPQLNMRCNLSYPDRQRLNVRIIFQRPRGIKANSQLYRSPARTHVKLLSATHNTLTA